MLMLSWLAGEVCGSEDTCTETQLNTGEVCGTSSTSGCSCAPDQLPEGSRCDLYGNISSCSRVIITKIITTAVLLAVLHFVHVAPIHAVQ